MLALSGTIATLLVCQTFQLPPKIREAHVAEREGKYLKSWRLLLEAFAEAKSSDEKGMIGGFLSQFAPVVGEVAAAREYGADDTAGVEAQPLPIINELEQAIRIGAIEGIVEAARASQIVILNEEHNSTQCRAFAWEVARALRPLGFSYLAIETLSPDLQSSITAGYPLRTIGYYTNDPFYADFVRQGMKDGYRLVEYEARHLGNVGGDQIDGINAREAEQATNLIERVLKQDPSAKLFIYVGYSHATEDWGKSEDGRELGWLAARLKRMTGIDPLTIDQTTMSERAIPANENLAYRVADSKLWLKTPQVFRRKSGGWFVSGPYKDRVDMQVFHPRSIWREGRAQWQRMGGYRLDVDIPREWIPGDGRVLIQAFVDSETKDPLPMDQVIVSRAEPAKTLLLPTGKYRIVRQDEEGNATDLGTIEAGLHQRGSR